MRTPFFLHQNIVSPTVLLDPCLLVRSKHDAREANLLLPIFPPILPLLVKVLQAQEDYLVQFLVQNLLILPCSLVYEVLASVALIQS
jgi:hypothetical protein